MAIAIARDRRRAPLHPGLRQRWPAPFCADPRRAGAAGEEAEVDMEKDVLTNLTTGKTYPLKPIGEVRPWPPAASLALALHAPAPARWPAALQPRA
jgi:hypothetical protein